MISVVTWDAGFREAYHTVDFFRCQSMDKSQFEFIWADFYSTINPELNNKIQAMGNGRTFCLGGEGKWHLGRTLNAAIQKSMGDLIVIPDGDIIVEKDFLEEVARCHEKYQDLVLYFRRWDEQNPQKERKDYPSISMLSNICRLTNPTNYGGCLTISKKTFNHVQGYEEHDLFSEAGANGMELYTRLKNAGFPIMWHPTHKIYHPWHKGTALGDASYNRKVDLQKWVIEKRDLGVITHPSAANIDKLIQEYRSIFPVDRNWQQRTRHFFSLAKKYLIS